ncbi:NADH-quinone oxidoreductase subunit E [Pseudoprimorskyibacter insulae]|uniref:NADH-quinone oxidoreductase chain 2 n=1 Tax=Pseudoprimorskyibacter insulae TaxID=1695997 RepID=A0A2R8AWY4_9RHOB|nr:NADH-quinone oxidoreductase subunit E [Pseudoprimorskyibacter insulae]SPF80551.1 NADH-quinone oxidoreductase chain 2 [Pseudoprimorskyibacter insulae]
MLRRLHSEQPESFAFTPANLEWAQGQITKYPAGRAQSAIIPLLWRAQEQEGWLSKPAIEHIADMLGMAYIRALEVATFYFMFQLTPTGSVAHVQICGTTSCMICGAEDLIAVCKEKIAPKPFTLSADGKFTWEEVECLGACTNAPMAQIGKDYYEDLTADGFAKMLDDLAAGKVPVPGPQNGRYAAEPKGGVTSLAEYAKDRHQYNASVQLATDIGDTVKRIDGTEVPILTPWGDQSGMRGQATSAPAAKPVRTEAPADKTGIDKREAQAESVAKPEADVPVENEGTKPEQLTAARDGGPDDLKQIKGVGPKLEGLLHELGFYHFDQVASWTADEVAWVDQNLKGFKGRVSRDGWVDQAKVLAAGGETEFSSRVKKGGVYDE